MSKREQIEMNFKEGFRHYRLAAFENLLNAFGASYSDYSELKWKMRAVYLVKICLWIIGLFNHIKDRSLAATFYEVAERYDTRPGEEIKELLRRIAQLEAVHTKYCALHCNRVTHECYKNYVALPERTNV